MSEQRIVEVVAGIAASSREPLYAFTSEQVEALKTLGLKMIPVREDRIVEGVLEDLREAGFDVYRPGRVALADRLRRGAEWLEAPPDGMVEAAAKAIHDNDRGTRPTKDERWDQLGEIQEFYHLLARAALVAAARWEAPGE